MKTATTLSIAELTHNPHQDGTRDAVEIAPGSTFQEWFGQSKIVTPDGSPAILYHGSNSDFSTFNKSKRGVFGSGIYFTSDPLIAADYAEGEGLVAGQGASILPVYARISHPYYFDVSMHGDGNFNDDLLRQLDPENAEGEIRRRHHRDEEHFGPEIEQALRARGHDGLIARYPDGSQEVVVFESNQVKSAIGNTGAYSPNNDDIRYATADVLNDASLEGVDLDAIFSLTPIEELDTLTLSKIIQMQDLGRKDGWFSIDAAAFLEDAISDKRKTLTRSPAFRTWFGKSQVTDKRGLPLIVYHGTTHDFTTFSASKAYDGGNFGAAFYFSNSTDDVNANYAREDGVDLQSRTEERASEIASDSEFDGDYDEARAAARRQLVGEAHNILPVYLKIETPLILDGHRGTYWDFTYDDDYSEPSGKLQEYYEALKTELLHGDYHGYDLDLLHASLFADRDQGDLADYLIAATLSSEGLLSVFDGDIGRRCGSEIIRLAIQRMGYDGIIDRTVNMKFGSAARSGKPMPGMNMDTVHYIVFDPAQVKSATGNTGTFSLENADIRFDRLQSRIEQPQSVTGFPEWFGTSKVISEDGAPLLVFRGEHGPSTMLVQTRLGSISFGSVAAANTYAMRPNNVRDEPVAPRILPAYLRIENPIIENRDDPFIDLSVLVTALGMEKAISIAIKFAEAIEGTGNWVDNYSSDHESVASMINTSPEKINGLYLDTYQILDDIEVVDWLKEAGYDGAIHVGNGETAFDIEYRIFDVAQIMPAVKVRQELAPGLDPLRFDRRLQHNPTDRLARLFANTKVVDSLGRARIVYHGTEHKFDRFDTSRGGQAMGVRNGYVFFTSNIDNAKFYGHRVMPAFLMMRNPLIVTDMHGKSPKQWADHATLSNYFYDTEYDGVIIQDCLDGIEYSDIYIAFEPNQIEVLNTASYRQISKDAKDTRETLTAQTDQLLAMPHTHIKDAHLGVLTHALRYKYVKGNDPGPNGSVPFNPRTAPIRDVAIEAKLIKALSDFFGVKVGILRQSPASELKFNGLCFDDTLWINSESERPLHVVFGHEFVHKMRMEQPRLYAELNAVLSPMIHDDTRYASLRGLHGKDAQYVREELIADLVGARFGEPNFWETIARANPSIFRRIADYITGMLHTVVQVIKETGVESPLCDAFVRDVDAARRVIARTVSKFSRDVYHDELRVSEETPEDLESDDHVCDRFPFV